MQRFLISTVSVSILGSIVVLAGCQSSKPMSGDNAVGASPSHDTDYNSRLGGNPTNNMGQAAPATMGSNTTR